MLWACSSSMTQPDQRRGFTAPLTHEPTHPRPLPGGERAFVGVLSVPLLGGVRGGFMVPMRGAKVVQATHELERTAGRMTREAAGETPAAGSQVRQMAQLGSQPSRHRSGYG